MSNDENDVKEIKNGKSLFYYRGEDRTENMCKAAFERDNTQYSYIPDKFKTLKMTQDFIIKKIKDNYSFTGISFPREHILADDRLLQKTLIAYQDILMWDKNIFSAEDRDNLELGIDIFLMVPGSKQKDFKDTYKSVTKDKYDFFNIPVNILKEVRKNKNPKALTALMLLYKD